MHIRRHCVLVRAFAAVAALAVAWSATRTVDAAAQLPRIVSLSPHITELLFAAGTLAVATQAAREFQADLADLRMRYAGRARLEVFYQVWDRPLYTLSGTHVVSEVLSLCGGDNIFADLSTLAPAVDN